MTTEPINVTQQLVVLQQRLKNHQEAARLAEEQITGEIAQLRKQISSGSARLEDRLANFLFAVYGIFNEPKILDEWKALEAKLSGQTEQLLLLVTRKRERVCFGGPGSERERDYQVVTHAQLCMLSGEELLLDLEKQEWGLPVKQRIALEGLRTSPEDGPIQFPFFQPVHLLDKPVTAGFQGGPQYEIFVGDDFVFEQAKILGASLSVCKDLTLLVRAAARKLGKELPELPEEVEARVTELNRIRERLNQLRDAWRKCPAPEARSILATALQQAQTEFGLVEDPLVKLVERELANKTA